MDHVLTMQAPPNQILKGLLLKKKQTNPSYSLRAFARDLKMSHSFLSLVISGKKKLPLKRVLYLSQALGLDEKQAATFLQRTTHSYWGINAKNSPYDNKPIHNEWFMLELDRFKSLSEWYHLAILDLTQTKDFRPNIRWVGKKLRIKAQKVKAAVNRLERLGLLKVSSTSWTKTHKMMDIPTHTSTQAIRTFHKQMIQKALDALELGSREDYLARDITGTTMAINPRRLPEAKRRIARFRKNLMTFLSQGETTELYQLNVQLFSLTRRSRQEKGNGT